MATQLKISLILALMGCCFFQLAAQELNVEKIEAPLNTPDFDEISPIISWDGKTIFFTRVAYPHNRKSLVINGEEISSTSADNYSKQLSEIYSTIADRPISNPEKSVYNQDVWIGIFGDKDIEYYLHPMTPLNNALPNAICSLTPNANEFIVINQFPESGGMDHGFSRVRWNSITQWSNPEPIQIEDYYTKSEGVSLGMSSDGEIMVASLTRDDTYGKNDLYAVFRKGENYFSAPINLGKDINSSARETTPTLSADTKTLYFSSNRDGDNDIYFARRLDETWQNWSLVRKFKMPINSDYDDSQPFFNAATGYLYFSSNRDGTSDIFRVKIADPEITKIKIAGEVINSQTNQLIPAQVLIREVTDFEFDTVFTANKGTFVNQFFPGKKYIFEAAAEGFISNPVGVDSEEAFFKKDYKVKLFLDPILVGGKISLDAIYFQQSKPIILEKSYPSLNRLIEILQYHPDLKISIEGHTDNQGDRYKLIKLSEDRAAAIKSYLTGKGIAANRLVTKGLGASRPVTNNSTEALRARNRRVEFKILSFDPVARPMMVKSEKK